MYKLKQNVILITICLLIYTSAMPQQNIKYSNNLQINEKEEFNINKINKELNENVTKPITNILTDRGSDLLKEELKSSYVSDIFRSQETDLRALNIPFNSKQNNINILSSVAKTKVDNNKIINNNENTFKTTQFNEHDLSDLSVFYNSHNNNLDILNTAIKSLNSNQNKTEINLEGNKQEKIEDLNEKSLKESLNLNTPTTSTTTSTTTTSTTSSPTTTDISTTTIDTNPASDINTSSTTKISTKIPDTNESPDSNNPTTTEIISIIPETSANDEIILSEIAYLSSTDDAEQNVGQKIQVQRSAVGSDVEERSNSAGAEILRNVSLTCGSLFGKRISFANQTTLMEFPWTALLLYNTNIRYHCGGSLITQKYVLTAAHCVAEEFYELSGVRLGEHDITENPDCAPDIAGQDICATTVDADIVKIIIHHAFSHLSFKNDIALLQLDKEYSGRSFYPICLPKPNEEYKEKQATVAGWGATQNAIRSAVLLKAEVPVLDMSRCREIYRYSVFNDSTEICGSGANEVDVCKGDSGGALFLSKTIKSREKFFQLGIISLGVRRCGDTRFLPAVFTKVQGFYKWIENNLES